MLSVKAMYENGKVTLLERIPGIRRARVIVTVLEEKESVEQDIDISLFDDMVGAVSLRNDGSINHDKYLTEESS